MIQVSQSFNAGDFHQSTYQPTFQPNWYVPTPPTWTPPWTLKPHVCPVCKGKQTVKKEFYDGPGAVGTETCRTCQGTGILWGT